MKGIICILVEDQSPSGWAVQWQRVTLMWLSV